MVYSVIAEHGYDGLVLTVLADLTVAIGVGVGFGLAIRLRASKLKAEEWRAPEP